MEHGKVSHDFVTISQWCDKWSQMVTSQTVTVGHMTRVTWGPWESKRIATVVKCISSREMSENSIEFSLSNSEQRDSWLNSGHQILDADKEIEKETLYSTALSHVSPLWHHHAAMTAVTFLSSIPPGHDHVTLLHLHTSLLPIAPRTPNRLPSTPNTA